MTTPHPYPAYKPSNIPWLGDVPVHWEVRPIKTLFREREERSKDGIGELLSLTRTHGLVPQSKASNRMALSENLANYKVCHPGEIVMNRMQAWSGMFAVPKSIGLVSPDYCVFGTVVPCEIHYFEHLFKLPEMVGQFVQRSKGVGSGFNRLYTDDFGSIRTIYPPLPEQRAIVRYLDHADRRIRRYITAKRKLIALLEEEKQAIINQAVTRGLAPNVPLKPSGVEWLGDVPEHWEVRRLKQVCSSSALYGANIASTDYQMEGARFLRTTDIAESGQLLSGGVFLPRELVSEYLLRDGDILLSRSGTIGRSFLYSSELHGECAYAGYLVRFVPNAEISPKLLFYFTKAGSFSAFLRVMAIASTIENVNAGKYANMPIPLPPLLEQQAIVEHLDRATANLDTAITRARRQIELVQEYRTRLIADVVTGKLDVRKATAQLPEDPDVVQPIDEDGPVSDNDGGNR